MATQSGAPAEGGTPAYVIRFDGVRVPATDYRPAWLNYLADDVTIEGSAMNGVAHGAEAVRSIVTYIRTPPGARTTSEPGIVNRGACCRTRR